MAARGELPVWVDVALIPLLNLLFALVISDYRYVFPFALHDINCLENSGCFSTS